MLLTVTALGALLGPMTGLVAGFCGGLAMDIAPSAGHLAGEYALVFCLAGYACGRMRDLLDPMEEHATIASVTVMAIGAAAGEAAKAALGLMLSDPDVTGPAVTHVLPGAILYDLLLSPFVLWLTALAVARPGRAHAPETRHQAPRTLDSYGAVRQTPGAVSAPKLKLAGRSAGADWPGKNGNGRSNPGKAPGGRSGLVGRGSTVPREPRLRLAGSISPALSRTGNGVSPSSGLNGSRRPVSLKFSSSGGLLGSSLLHELSGGGGGLGPSLFSGSPLRRASGPGKGWLNGSGGGTGRPGGPSGPARGIAGSGPGRGWLRSSSGRSSSALRAAPSRSRRGSSPGKGWIRPTAPPKAPRLSSPGKGWLRPAKPAKTARLNSPSKGWLRPSKPVKTPRRHSPSRGWLNGGGHKPGTWRRKSPGRGWLNGSGALGKPTTYQSRSVPVRRRRGPRIGGRR
jgi:hypothetical protein